VKCRNTRSLKTHWSFRNHKFCWLFLTCHWVIGLLQLFHSHLLQLNSFILHVYLENDNQTYEVAEIIHGYTDKETKTLSGSLTEKSLYRNPRTHTTVFSESPDTAGITSLSIWKPGLSCFSEHRRKQREVYEDLCSSIQNQTTCLGLHLFRESAKGWHSPMSEHSSSDFSVS